MVVTDTSPPASDEAERVQLTFTLAEFRSALEEEIDAVRRAGRHAIGADVRDAP